MLDLIALPGMQNLVDRFNQVCGNSLLGKYFEKGIHKGTQNISNEVMSY